jgi:hypothetical protein
MIRRLSFKIPKRSDILKQYKEQEILKEKQLIYSDMSPKTGNQRILAVLGRDDCQS